MKNEINGVLLFNKPTILSSNIALQKVKRLYNAKKAGHTGTLDPLATGLLPICFGEATKFSGFLLNADKEYTATIKLGETTTTYDACGEIVASANVNVTINEIKNVVMSFFGEITQIPPIYSALKVNGKRLYEYARSGEEVAIKSRQISIKEIEVMEFGAGLSNLSLSSNLSFSSQCESIKIKNLEQQSCSLDYINTSYETELESNTDNTFKIRVLCSKGTYIRTLAHDIGCALGCGAHLTELTRTKTSGFALNQSINLDNLSQMSDSERQNLLLPCDVLVADLDKLELEDSEFAYIQHGRTLENVYNIPENKLLRLYYDGNFLGVAEALNHAIRPSRLMNLTLPKL